MGLLQALETDLLLHPLKARAWEAESRVTSGRLCLEIGYFGYCLFQSLQTITLSALLCVIWPGLGSPCTLCSQIMPEVTREGVQGRLCSSSHEGISPPHIIHGMFSLTEMGELFSFFPPELPSA